MFGGRIFKRKRELWKERAGAILIIMSYGQSKRAHLQSLRPFIALFHGECSAQLKGSLKSKILVFKYSAKVQRELIFFYLYGLNFAHVNSVKSEWG